MARPFAFAKFTRKGEQIIITVPLAGGRPSASAKTIILCSDSGTTGVTIDTPNGPREIAGNINVTVYPDAARKCKTVQTNSTSKLTKNILEITTKLFPPAPSASGKTLIVAKDSGGVGAQLAGQDIMATFALWVHPTEK